MDMGKLLEKILYWNTREARKNFLEQEYNYLNKEILQKQNNLNDLVRKRSRIETLLDSAALGSF
jgi:hypothetical protein